MTRSSASTGGLILAAASSNSGKTTLSLGLQRLLVRNNVRVASAKCGPDYIDPAFHQVASGGTSINLDPWAMRPDDVIARSAIHGTEKDLLFVEGVMGVFDGAAHGQGSTAHLARTLKLPVILVLDVKGQAQTSAAIARGIQSFDPEIEIGGVLLNRVGSKSHELLLREAFEQVQIPILGAVRSSDKLSLPSRHLGLVQATEHDELNNKIDLIADHMAQTVDLDGILKLAKSREAHKKHPQDMGSDIHRLPPLGQRIAIAKDAAFTFIYPHLIEDWQAQGAEISFFSPLNDEAPDMNANAIYLPGGYPELHLPELVSANRFKTAMQTSAKEETLIFAECGGYMVTGRAIVSAKGDEAPMLDLLPLITDFSKPKLSLGYRKLQHNSALPWPAHLRAHEFHYASILWQGDAEALFEASSATNRKLPAMGMRKGSVHGSFAHIIAPSE